MKLKIDLHVHTARSSDAVTPIADIPRICRKRGIDGVAITDHNLLALELPNEATFLPGIEISSQNGHIIGLGLTSAVKRGLSADVTIREIRDRNGIVIIPHPYDLVRSSVKLHLLHEKPDAIETVNASSLFHWIPWRRAREYAIREDLPQVAGSDAHIPTTIGRAFTEIDASSTDLQSILSALRAGRVSPAGTTISLPERLRKRVSQAKKVGG